MPYTGNYYIFMKLTHVKRGIIYLFIDTFLKDCEINKKYLGKHPRNSERFNVEKQNTIIKIHHALTIKGL